jgi:HAD superfamily hydrolase (TIGR01549 family)
MDAFADLAADVISRGHGIEARHARRLYRETSGIPFRDQLDLIFGDHAANEPAGEEFERRKEAIALQADMEPVTRAALDGLRARGIALVISSNGFQAHVDAFARKHPGLFTLALGHGGGLTKGEPHVQRVCDQLGVGRQGLLFVGDSLQDARLATNTGIGFVAKAGTLSETEFRVRIPSAPVIRRTAELAYPPSSRTSSPDAPRRADEASDSPSRDPRRRAGEPHP